MIHFLVNENLIGAKIQIQAVSVSSRIYANFQVYCPVNINWKAHKLCFKALNNKNISDVN